MPPGHAFIGSSEGALAGAAKGFRGRGEARVFGEGGLLNLVPPFREDAEGKGIGE